MKMVGSKEKCNMIVQDQSPKGHHLCKEFFYIAIPVRVFHIKSGIKRWQMWPFCEAHFRDFMTRNGEGFSYIKRKDRSLIAVVIGFKTLEGVEVKVETKHH
jgi:hypothetical protein